MARSALQTTASGGPAVATDVGGTREALPHGVLGSLCLSADSDALRESLIVKLLRDGAGAAAAGRSTGRRASSEASDQA